MRTTSQTYKTLFEVGSIQEYMVQINGVSYFNDVLYSVSLTQNLFNKDMFTVGSFCSSQIKIKFKIDTGAIPRNAHIKFFLRYVGSGMNAGMVSEWIQMFDGRVTKRSIVNSVTQLEAKDVAANNDIFLDIFQTQVSSYPANTRAVVRLIADYLGLQVDNISDVFNGNLVEYPNEMTIVQVMENIALMSGGNWIITGDGRLRLVIIDESYDVICSYSAKSYSKSEKIPQISRVTVYYDDKRGFTQGNDNGLELDLDCPWATQTTTNNIFNKVSSIYYNGMKGVGVLLDPAAELGDTFLYSSNGGGDPKYLGQQNGFLGLKYDNGAFRHLGGKGANQYAYQAQLAARLEWTFDGSCSATVTAPQNNEVIYDDPYNELVKKQFQRKVSLGESYHGITIGRADGLQMVYSPDGTLENAEARGYFDLTHGLAFQTRKKLDDGNWGQWNNEFYYDIVEKAFKLTHYNTANEIIALFEVNSDNIKQFVGDNYETLNGATVRASQTLLAANNYTITTKEGTLQTISAIYETKEDAYNKETQLTESIHTIENTASLFRSEVESNFYNQSSAISRIEQKADNITLEVHNNYAKTTTVDSKIMLGIDGISLSVSNPANSSNLSITLNPGTGGASKTASITLNGLVNFINNNIDMPDLSPYATLQQLRTTNATVINGSNITTGTIYANYIHLGGQMSVYSTATSNSLGGYLGFMKGNDGISNTNGIAISNINQTAYCIATSSGVRVSASGTSMYINTNGIMTLPHHRKIYITTDIGDISLENYIKRVISY